MSIWKPRVLLPVLASLLVASRSATLSGRYTLYCPSETHPLPYLYWRYFKDNRSRIAKPVEGLERLLERQRQLGALPAGLEWNPTLATRNFALPEDGHYFVNKDWQRLPSGTNVVFILAESLGRVPAAANPAIAPFTLSQRDSSVWLDNHFTNSFRTCGAQFAALCSLDIPLTSYPSRDYPRVAFRCLPRVLSDAGYETHFITGNAAEFDNNADWMKVNGVDHVLAEADFSESAKRFSYGIHDEELVGKVVGVLDAPSEKPKFLFVITTSNHHPYTVPKDFLVSHPETAAMQAYEQTYYYADNMLARFFDAASKKPWYNNTLIVVMGDHNPWGVAGLEPAEAQSTSEARFRYQTFAFLKHPLIEPHLVTRDTTHLNLAPTILALLGMQDVRSDLLHETVFDERVSPWISSQENTRGGLWLLHSAEQSFSLSAVGSSCRAQFASQDASRECQPEERSLSQDFRRTFFDVVQWEILEMQRAAPKN